jgi:hypothetical protein
MPIEVAQQERIHAARGNEVDKAPIDAEMWRGVVGGHDKVLVVLQHTVEAQGDAFACLRLRKIGKRGNTERVVDGEAGAAVSRPVAILTHHLEARELKALRGREEGLVEADDVDVEEFEEMSDLVLLLRCGLDIEMSYSD